MSTPIEITTKYATTVDQLADAWAFVMGRLDHVGPAPQIGITPIWVYGADDDGTRKFEVVVSGMVHEGSGDE